MTFEECLLTLSQGKKLQYGAANYLLLGIMRSLCVENCQSGDEFQPGESTEDTDLDPTLSQIMANASSQENDNAAQGTSAGTSTSEANESDQENRREEKTGNPATQPKTPKYGKRENPTVSVPKQNKPKDEICRFYMNGKCKHKADCRFAHPKICPKFRQDGDCEVKGCSGDCNFLHPNVCRNSLKDKTCTYSECRFFHLKGTKTVERKTGPSKSKSNNPNWRENQPRNTSAGYEQKQNNNRQNTGPKNGQTGLSQKIKKKRARTQIGNRKLRSRSRKKKRFN